MQGHNSRIHSLNSLDLTNKDNIDILIDVILNENINENRNENNKHEITNPSIVITKEYFFEGMLFKIQLKNEKNNNNSSNNDNNENKNNENNVDAININHASINQKIRKQTQNDGDNKESNGNKENTNKNSNIRKTKEYKEEKNSESDDNDSDGNDDDNNKDNLNYKSNFEYLKNKMIDIAILQLNPICSPDFINMEKYLKKEFEMLCYKFEKTNKKCLIIYYSHLTKDSLCLSIERGANILHISGHGFGDFDKNNTEPFFVMEDINFMKSNEYMMTDNLTMFNILSSFGKSQIKLKLVILSLCHSEFIAKPFIDYGIKHVIAVHKKTRLASNIAQIFLNVFYEKLLCFDETIQNAYNSAIASYKISVVAMLVFFKVLFFFGIF